MGQGGAHSVTEFVWIDVTIISRAERSGARKIEGEVLLRQRVEALLGIGGLFATYVVSKTSVERRAALRKTRKWVDFLTRVTTETGASTIAIARYD